VSDAVVRRLRGDGVNPGYFGPDTFTFSAPLHRLTLEAVVGAVLGVLAVKQIRIGARTIHDMRTLEQVYVVPDDQFSASPTTPAPPSAARSASSRRAGHEREQAFTWCRCSSSE